MRSFDFDIVTAVWGQSLSPGNEQRDWFGSQAADRPGSRNVGGIKNPAVDALIERIIFAKRPRRTGGGNQGDGPRAAVEFLRRAAIRLRLSAYRALGSFQPSRAVAEIRRFRIPDAVVV